VMAGIASALCGVVAKHDARQAVSISFFIVVTFAQIKLT